MSRPHREGLALPHWLEGLECALDDIAELLQPVQPEWAKRLEGKINLILQLEGFIISDQDILDADVAKLVASFNNIAAEIAALKNQPAAAGLDFSGVDDVISKFGSLETPEDTTPPADTPPADTPPADVPPVDTNTLPDGAVPADDTSAATDTSAAAEAP